MDQAYIYKIISPSGKIYVGQTIDLKNRLYSYKSSKAKGQNKLNSSLLKYGWEQHSFEVIDQCTACCRKLLDILEIYWIKELNACGPNGLNLTSGGVRYIMSDEQKEKLRAAGLGKKQSAETIAKRVAKNKGQKRSKEYCNRFISKETRFKRSESLKGRIVSEETKLKLKLAGIGHKVSDATKEKLRLANLGKTKRNKSTC